MYIFVTSIKYFCATIILDVLLNYFMVGKTSSLKHSFNNVSATATNSPKICHAAMPCDLRASTSLPLLLAYIMYLAKSAAFKYSATFSRT